MGSLTERAERLRIDLLAALDTTLTQPQINRLRDRVADLLLQAFWDEHHPLSVDLADLEQRVELDRKGTLYRDFDSAAITARPNPRRHLFMPHPGAGDPEARRLWRLQLLLQAAAQSAKHRPRLAERLSMSASRLRLAATNAAHASVDMWSEREYGERLAEAVGSLGYSEPSLPFRLEGRILIPRAAKSIRLSAQQAIFLSLLIDRVGCPVSFSKLGQAGISHPKETKSRLDRKLREHGIELPIGSLPNAYLLSAGAPMAADS